MTTKTKKNAAPKAQKEQQKKTQTKEHLARNKLLGEVITWDTGGPVSHSQVQSALKSEGFDPAIAKDLAPSQAFYRACKQLESDRLIDVVSSDNDKIYFQLTKKGVKEGTSGETGEMEYVKETNLSLDKTTGKIGCRSHSTKEKVQSWVDRELTTRYGNDISTIIKKLVDTAGIDLFSLRRRGGTYFVFSQHEEFTNKLERFLLNINCRLNRFPVPAGTKQGDESVGRAVEDNIKEVLEDYNQLIDEFTVTSKNDTLQNMAEKIKQTRLKVEAYAIYLGDLAKNLLEEADSAAGKLAEKIKVLTDEKRTAPPDHTAMKPGVVRELIKQFLKADETSPVSKKTVWEHLCKTFPEREPAKMKATVNQFRMHVKNRLPEKQIKKNEQGYWLADKV